MGILVVPTWKYGQDLGETGDEIAQGNPGSHGQENPQGQEALHETQAFGNSGGHKCSYLFDIRITVFKYYKLKFLCFRQSLRRLFLTGLQPLGAFGVLFGLQAMCQLPPQCLGFRLRRQYFLQELE